MSALQDLDNNWQARCVDEIDNAISGAKEHIETLSNELQGKEKLHQQVSEASRISLHCVNSPDYLCSPRNWMILN